MADKKKDINQKFIKKVLTQFENYKQSDVGKKDYAIRVIDAYTETFSACQERQPHFEDCDAVIVMDREGRIPYYGMKAYCEAKGLPVPEKEKVFYLKTSNLETSMLPLILKSSIKKSLKGTEFNNQLERLIASKEKPQILLIDGSKCQGHQASGLSQFMTKAYGNHFDYMEDYIVQRILWGGYAEAPLILDRNFLEMMPTNILTSNGFETYFKKKETGKEIVQEGFMNGDTIGSEREDDFVSDLKDVGKYLAEYLFAKPDQTRSLRIRVDGGNLNGYYVTGNEKKLKKCLVSNSKLVDTLRRVDKAARDFDKSKIHYNKF